MENNENTLSDKKLLNYIRESDIKKIAELFSAGNFSEIINTYFKKIKNQTKDTINIQTLQQFFNENNKKNNVNNNNFNFNNNNLKMNNKENFNTDFSEENIVGKTLTFNTRGNSFHKNFDYILNTPPNSSNKNLINSNNGNENKINNDTNPYKNPVTNNNVIDDYYSKNTEEKEFDYSLLDKFENDKLTQQILLTIIIYCLIKMDEENEIKNLLVKYNIPNEKCIFSLILLKSKFYFKIKAIVHCMDIYAEAISNYDNFKLNYNINEANNNNIIYIETYNQDFTYFSNLFNYLFALNNIDSKIKKLYYEQKFILYYMNFYQQGYKLLLELYNKYPQDIQIQFELSKDSAILSKFDVFSKIFEVLKKEMNEEQNENKKLILTNYLLYLQGLSYLAQGKFDETKISFNNILKNDSINIVLNNNISLLSIYNNKAKESIDNLKLIESPNQMDSSNECIKENINILKDKFNADLQKIIK